jgi:hypothetical protein
MSPSALVFVSHDDIKDLKYAYESTSSVTIHNVSDIAAEFATQHLDIGATLGIQRILLQGPRTQDDPIDPVVLTRDQFRLINISFKTALVQPRPQWDFGSAGARTAPGTYTKAQIGQDAIQTDDKTFWELVSFENTADDPPLQQPTWQPSDYKFADMIASLFVSCPMLFFAPFTAGNGFYTAGGHNFYAAGPDPAVARGYSTFSPSVMISGFGSPAYKSIRLQPYFGPDPFYIPHWFVTAFAKMTTNFVRWKIPINEYAPVGGLPSTRDPFLHETGGGAWSPAGLTDDDLGAIAEQKVIPYTGATHGPSYSYSILGQVRPTVVWGFYPQVSTSFFPNYYNGVGMEFSLNES